MDKKQEIRMTQDDFNELLNTIGEEIEETDPESDIPDEEIVIYAGE